MSFFSSAAAAEGAGYRPCLRCRPELAPGLAPVDATSRLTRAVIAGIEEYALSNTRLDDLASSLGVSDRHLRRVTEAELGVTPIELAQTQRLLFAKRLISETSLKLTDIAFASGFGSLRRFNALFKSRYRLNPSALRRARAAAAGAPAARKQPVGSGLKCALEFRPPIAWDALLGYLRLRAIPRVESVDGTHYRRTVKIGDFKGWISVSLAKSGVALDVEMSPSLTPVIGAVMVRVKRLFDLGAVPDAVHSVLTADALLAPALRRLPGLRVAGAFDGFELAVRAVIGQQVSVKAATTVAGRWTERFGDQVVTPYSALDRLSPAPERMAGVDPGIVAALGIVGRRARTLIALAEAVASRRVVLAQSADVEAQIESLAQLPGVGPWTAQYIAMRALHWPDAFPAGDLMLLRAAGLRRKELEARAESWRPWRAYAAHYLWQSLGDKP